MTMTTKRRGRVPTKIALLAAGAAIGLSIYNKKYKPLRSTTESRINLELDTSNVVLPSDIDHYFSVAMSAALAAGETISKFIHDQQSKSTAVQTKYNHTDLATVIDKKCEEIIVSKIKEAFPDHAIIAEESCKDPTKFKITDAPTWFIDPIDGTTNFFHGLPFVAVCIGLRINKAPVLGIVHCPILRETFHGILGRGSFIIYHDSKESKTSRLQTSSESANDLKKAIILTECGYDRSAKWVNAVTRRLRQLLVEEKVRAIRSIGSCAISMCLIACGRATVFYEGRSNTEGPKPWDFTAAEIIVHEAGGITVDPEGRSFDCTQGRVLCCNSLDTARYVLNLGLYRRGDR